MALQFGSLALAEQFDEQVTVITINRPERHNAVDVTTARAMEGAIDSFEAEPHSRVAILRGVGSSFSAGQDLKAAAVGCHRAAWRVASWVYGIRSRSSPQLIAAVEGHALAGGLELCVACDLIVAGEDTMMGIPEAPKTLVAVGGGLFRLP
ncbi:enoyl-CoA hydratase-related protein [Gordonia alkanivorans]|uniref:Putative enoyl-CoA hydratase n=1 Tax=Gordonia alkanivorans NBRC 16433 TaxID=1027371 RepID=F9VRR9_9ACTN|nr:enoyl-CoA hydratase-related protein [Gordonia alkanivorans]GAA11308.1 putative enoyl-CoA hydratase [Gordonia alkanivorans NBRC 16433]